MAYPGEGYTMSNYGLKVYTPEQEKEQWKEACTREEKLAKNQVVFTGKVASDGTENQASLDLHLVPTSNYFNTTKQHSATSTYDRMFHIKEGYCSKLHRDDRQHTRGLDVHSEEVNKAVPVLSSSLYGHRRELEQQSRQHVRVALVQRDFYRFGGTNIPLANSS
jgi:hypothetical protein